MKNVIALFGLMVTVGFLGEGAEASSVYWTVAHGGEGTVILNDDGTFSSNCAILPGYQYAVCPSSSGKFRRGTGGSAQYFYFDGFDGKTVSYRLSGSATSPDTMTQIKNGQYYRGLIIKKGDHFICSEFYDSVYNFSKGPIGVSCGNGNICAAGSLQLLGPANSTYVLVSETSPGYFEKGQCQQ